MAINFPGPYEVRINYTCTLAGATRAHQHRVSVYSETEPEPGETFDFWDLQGRDLSTVDLDTWTDAYIVLMKDLYSNSTAAFQSAELWLYEEGTFNAAFQSVKALSGAGTNAGGGIVDGQAIISFRSQNGGVAKLDFRETVLGAGITVPVGSAAAEVQAIADFVIDSTSPVIARDNGYVFAALNLLPGLNERAFKKRNR